MKVLSLLLLLLLVLFTSCKSEYEERLEQAKELKEKILVIEESNFLNPNAELIHEINEMEARIRFLAKVSGNEEVFLSELNY